MKSSELGKKVDRSIRFLQSVANHGDEIELAYSGGKDSDVILHLSRMAGIDIRPIYKNTTIDPPGTIRHCKENGVEILAPKERFFSLVERHGFPSRWARFCCENLKEYKVMDKAILGIRRSESQKRKQKYTEPEVCRKYRNKKGRVLQYLPILEWNDHDVAEFIRSEGIRLHDLYYRDDGTVDIRRRLGCIGCPLASRQNRVKEFQRYPLFLKQWVRHGDVFYANRTVVEGKAYTNASDALVSTLFFDNYTQYRKAKDSTLFGPMDERKLLEDFFKIEL